MISGKQNILDGAMIQKLKFDNIANNLANVDTNAFKRDLLSFSNKLSMETTPGIDFNPGPVVYTGNQLDTALASDGFFIVQTDKGARYTRNGSFSINAQGNLVTGQGDEVLGKNGSVPISGNQISIGKEGQVSVDNVIVDTLEVVSFKELNNLKKEGFSYYTYEGSEEDIVPIENLDIKQNYIEKSNVNPTEEMIRMIEAQRGFESCQKVIQVMSEMNQKIVNDLGMV